MVEDDRDAGMAGDDGLDRRLLLRAAEAQEAGAQLLGLAPDRVLRRSGPLGRIVGARQVHAQPLEAVLGDQPLQPLDRVRGVAVHDRYAREPARIAGQAVGRVAVVEQVVDGLDQARLVDAVALHGRKQQLHAAVLRRAVTRPRIALRVVAPDVQMAVDDHAGSRPQHIRRSGDTAMAAARGAVRHKTRGAVA